MKFNLSEENKTLLLNGAKSLAWRTAAFAAVGLLNTLAGLSMPPELQIIVGLVTGEVTKFLNRKYQLGKARNA